MRYLLSSFALILSFNSAFAVTQESLLSHFAPGARKASLGKLNTEAFFRHCTKLTGCSSWAPAAIEPRYSVSEQWQYDYNQNSNGTLSVSRGEGSVPMPEQALAELTLDHQTISLNLVVGAEDLRDQQSSPRLTAQLTYDPKAQAFSSSGGSFFGQYYSVRLPYENRYCTRDGMHIACLAGRTYVLGRLAVSDVLDMGRVQSIQFDEHRLEVLYQQKSEVHADGSYTEAQMRFSGTF
jgi:hypothetical protein